jgi:tetratricopeptide (TPR) repeat protein
VIGTRGRRLTAGAMLAVTLTSLAAPAAARGPSDPEGQAQARELFQQGSQAYDQARYDDAIAAFEEAYRISALPDLLFNIAQAYRQKGPAFCGTAERYYRRHLEQAPDVPNRNEIDELIREMSLCATAPPVATRAAPPAERAPAAPPSPPRESPLTLPVAVTPAPPPGAQVRPGWAHWLALTGGGVALLGLGGYTASWVKYQSVRDQCPCAPGRFRPWEIVTEASYIAMAAGGAAAAVGLALTLWSAPSTTHEAPLGAWLAPGAGGLRVGGRF